jgi:ferritin
MNSFWTNTNYLNNNSTKTKTNKDVNMLNANSYSNNTYSNNNNNNNTYSNNVRICDNLIDDQINMFLYGSYAYLVMSTYFSQNEKSMMGLSKLFEELSENKRTLSNKLIQYQQKHNKKIKFTKIDTINTSSWSAHSALKNLIDFEMSINTSLQKIYNSSNKFSNHNLSNFLQTSMINSQLDLIRQLNILSTQLKLCGQGHGLYIFDQNLLKKYNKQV